jgi:hypothetical protein
LQPQDATLPVNIVQAAEPCEQDHSASLLEKGIPFATVAQIMGWSAGMAVRMAKHYGHIRPEAQRLAVNAIAIAGHVSRRMLEHYSHIRMDAKRAAIEAIAIPVFEVGAHQIVHQNANSEKQPASKLLN